MAGSDHGQSGSNDPGVDSRLARHSGLSYLELSAIDRPSSREPGLPAYIYVDQIDDAVELVSGNGGEVVGAPYAEGNLSVATVRDPAGNLTGLWQKGAHRPADVP